MMTKNKVKPNAVASLADCGCGNVSWNESESERQESQIGNGIGILRESEGVNGNGNENGNGNGSRKESESESETVNPSTIDPFHHALRVFEKANGLVHHCHDGPENESWSESEKNMMSENKMNSSIQTLNQSGPEQEGRGAQAWACSEDALASPRSKHPCRYW